MNGIESSSAALAAPRLPVSPAIFILALLAAASACKGGCGTGRNAQTPAGDMPQDIRPASAARPIMIDGLLEDWDRVPAACVDPVGDGGGSGIDIKTIKIANDDLFLFILIDAGREIALDENQDLALYIDTDGEAGTGFPIGGTGAELRWVFGRRGGTFYREGGNFRVGFAEIRFRAAPTVTADLFEIAIGRREKPDGAHLLFPDERIGIILRDETAGGGDAAPDEGMGAILYEFDETPVDSPPAIQIEKENPRAVRIISYNVLRDGLTDPAREEIFRRIITAISPDILNFQELSNAEAARKKIEEWLPIPEGRWYSFGLGDRTTVSRYPIMRNLLASYEPLDERFTVVPVQVAADRTIVVINAHMSCCAGDSERQAQADSFIAYLRELMTPGGSADLPPGTPILLAGDLNLVGYAAQLRTLLEGTIVNQDLFGPPHPPDWDGTALADLLPRHIRERMTYTWRDDRSSFWPGRLDFVLYTDSVLAIEKGFILETGDSSAASDHLPVVADVLLKD